MNQHTWNPQSWREKSASQQPAYPDSAALQTITDELKRLPPLIVAEEVASLQQRLADVCNGKAFLLQAGDCAESFSEFSATKVRSTFQVLLQMAIVLTYAAQYPVVKVGRVAGQFAKPRSAAMEMQNGVSLPSYRGDIVNALEFSAAARTPRPERMREAYYQAAATLNLLRAISSSGQADLHRVREWNRSFIEHSPAGRRYQVLAENIENTLGFIAACGINAQNTPALHQIDVYASHEALLLPYEEALTRTEDHTDSYCASGHMLWIGERTRALDGAHIEFCRGLSNPLGVKLGPHISADELLRLIEQLNPSNIPGRLTLIVRMGAEVLQQKLPPLIRAVQDSGLAVIWSCDPMHGNTVQTATGLKTRSFDAIIAELQNFFAIHAAEGSHAGGIHLEMTGESVTECLGGAGAISEADLARCYRTHCDPRLNADQALEVAYTVADLLRRFK